MFKPSKLVVAISAFVAFSSITAVTAATLSIEQSQIIARRGADDKPGDDRGVHAPGHPLSQDIEILARRGRGADDKPGDDRGVHAPGHPLVQDADIVARRGRGADDAPGHVRREDRRVS